MRAAGESATAEHAAIECVASGCLRLRGPLDFASVAELWQAGRRMLVPEALNEIDLAAVERTDSAGVALLLEWHRAVEAAGGTLRLRHVPAQLQAILRASGVEALLTIVEVQEAPPPTDPSSFPAGTAGNAGERDERRAVEAPD
ncbi:hypothetical protein CKO15_02100 [Halorhodospira abdelmalekii]|uniref:STAS domain-containing protein n=1 Tax=Halorhodospira abdelmalekii TaxID=421629 RepID=UPI0019061464|nr:STAS domain-containing protein [Halorhodospira abdelmalekii]MBK1734092.1 hypothetical protein [Halorhodospira abdelmalekii]